MAYGTNSQERTIPLLPFFYQQAVEEGIEILEQIFLMYPRFKQ